MTPVYRAAHGLGWREHLAVLRSLSWLIAWSGWVIAVIATLRASTFATAEDDGHEPLLGPWTAPLMALWPLVFAEFFADLARLGNDSLCLFEVGVAWALLLRLAPARGMRPLTAVALELTLGAGLWTKAFFVPITGGIVLLLIVRAVEALRDRERAMGPLLDAVLVGVIAAAIGGPWYLGELHRTGSLSGADETIQLLHAGGLARGLAAHFSGGALLVGVRGVLQTLPWAATWSLVRLPSLFIYAGLLVGAAPFAGYLARLSRLPLLGWAPVAVAAPMLAGLFHHILVRIALDGSGLGTLGWYLNVVAPALAMALAVGWRAPLFTGLCAIYSIAYALVAQAWQLSLFSGCAGVGEARRYTLVGVQCVVDPKVLKVLGHPALSAGWLILALTLAVAALMLAKPWEALTKKEGKGRLTPLEP